jgi:hypothetical protein
MITKKTSTSTHAHSTVHAHAATDAKAESAVAPPAVAAPAPPAATPVPGSLEALVDAVLSSLASVATILGSASSPAAPLTIEQRRTMPKMKKGAEAQIPAILDLADRYGVALPGGTTAQARSDLQRAATIDTLTARLSLTLVLAEDQSRQAKGRSWSTTRRAYKALANLVGEFPALQTELEPMASFMATKHKDAPSILRTAEAKTLAKSRATKAKNKKGGATALAPAGGAVTASPAAGGQAAPTGAAGGSTSGAMHS